jgi:hypothetical protein
MGVNSPVYRGRLLSQFRSKEAMMGSNTYTYDSEREPVAQSTGQ